MELVCNYEDITLQNIEDNPHLTFVFDGDSKRIMIEREEEHE